MLVKYIGEKAVSRLIQSYKFKIDTSAYEEVTASFQKVFHPDLDDECFGKIVNLPKLKRRKSGKTLNDFDFGVFYQFVKKFNESINDNFFSKMN